MNEVNVVIDEQGDLSFIYNDDLAGLMDTGRSTIARASHVEPEVMPDGSILWYADMGPSGGPVLTGFFSREAALRGEVAWLRENRGL